MFFYEKEPVSLYLNELEEIEHIISSKQEIVMYRHPLLEKILVINGEIQHIENYQCPYHETLVHLPACFIPEISDVLIIGGGSLFAAYEILKYPSIKKVTLCDYDTTVLKLMDKHYPHAKNVLCNSKFHHIENDGLDFISKCREKYDLIINDCFNLLEVEKSNFPIYAKLTSLLSSCGVCSDIIYRHIFDGDVTHDSIKKIRSQGNLVLSLVTVPEYPGILHIETIWGNSRYISQNRTQSVNSYHKQVIEAKTLPFDFFSPQNVPFYLYLPPYIKAKL